VRAAANERIPDLGVTRAAHPGTRMISDPVVLIDILSPSNEAATRANVWAYATLPSVLEILILHSTRMEAELLRRDAAGTWPEQPTMLESADTLHPESIGFSAPMAAFYRAAVMT
jgi:Uma2 family endonuclease